MQETGLLGHCDHTTTQMLGGLTDSEFCRLFEREIGSMPRTFRIILLSLIAMGLNTIPTVWAQPPTAPPTGAAGSAPAAGRGPAIPGFNDVLATITVGTQTEKVTKGELVEILSRYAIPDDDRETLYRQGIDNKVNTKLLLMYLGRQKVAVAPEKVDEELEKLKQKLKSEGQDLASALLQTNTSMDDVRKQIEERTRWQEFLRTKATDAELRKYVANHRDLFRGTQIRASHILLKLEPNASVADKEKVKEKLASIKKEIEGGTISFAAAANKYSDDPANAGGAGGDLDYFSLNTGLIEEFTDVAFKLKKGMISDPVETPFGFHLIQVTDRKEGKEPDFEQNKPYIYNAYATDLQKEVVAAEKKMAKIDIKPMPKDLFPPAATTAPGGEALPPTATPVPAGEAAKAEGAAGSAAVPKQ
jgi:peptidyl-prolyl cis-trans isomerase C